jgi:hypothetical protein
MTTQPTVHPATPAATSIPQGMRPEIGCRAGDPHHSHRRQAPPAGADRGARVGRGRGRPAGRCRLRLPAGAGGRHPLHQPRRQPAAARAARPAGVGTSGRRQPHREPRAAAAPDPPDVPDWGPDDLANPTENPEPPLPPEDPDPAGDGSIPTPERVDAGFGGTAAGPHQAAGLALIAAAVMLALLFAVTVRRDRSGASR